MVHRDALRRMQFFADNPAQCGFDLFARHGLVERLIDECLIATITGFGFEERND
jgi:hypothetical protein